jgi:hypothetical protein
VDIEGFFCWWFLEFTLGGKLGSEEAGITERLVVDMGGVFLVMVGCYGLLWKRTSNLRNLGLPRDGYRAYGRLWFTLEANTEADLTKERVSRGDGYG